MTRRPESTIIVEAIRDFVELHEWQIQEIKDAINEADRGDFATSEEVGKVFHILQRGINCGNRKKRALPVRQWQKVQKMLPATRT